jgi:hypothetical protein
MSHNVDELLDKANKLLKAGVPVSKLIGKLAETDPEYIRGLELVPGELEGPTPFDGPARVHWFNQLRDNRAMVKAAFAAVDKVYEEIEQALNSTTSIGCFVCAAMYERKCTCYICINCRYEGCSGCEYVDTGRDY